MNKENKCALCSHRSVHNGSCLIQNCLVQNCKFKPNAYSIIFVEELKKIKTEMKEYWEWCDEEVQAPSLKGVRTIIDNHIAELKGENNDL